MKSLKLVFWLLAWFTAIVGAFTIVLYWPFIFNVLDKTGDEKYGWYLLGLIIGTWNYAFLKEHILRKLDEWVWEVDN